MTTYVTTKDIIESAKKYGNDSVLTWDPTVFRDNKAKNKNTKFDCTWVDIKFKFVSGIETPLKLKFSKVVTASGAKLPSTDDDSPKNMIIVFRTMTKEEMPDTTSKVMSAVSDDKKIQENTDIIFKATNDFNTSMEIIDKSYQKVCSELKSAQNLGFTIRKDKKVKSNADVNVYSIRQISREDKDTPGGDDIKLEFPLTRIKLILSKDARVGIDLYNNTTKGWDFHANVFDSRKMTAKNNYTPVLATVKENGKSCQLDSKNASVFITYKSIVGGIIEFPEIVVSKFGLSIANKFKELYVKRNKSNLTESAFSKEDYQNMGTTNESESEDDVEMPIIKVEETFAKIKISAVDAVSDLEDTISGSDLEDDCEESD